MFWNIDQNVFMNRHLPLQCNLFNFYLMGCGLTNILVVSFILIPQDRHGVRVFSFGWARPIVDAPSGVTQLMHEKIMVLGISLLWLNNVVSRVFWGNIMKHVDHFIMPSGHCKIYLNCAVCHTQLKSPGDDLPIDTWGMMSAFVACWGIRVRLCMYTQNIQFTLKSLWQFIVTMHGP